MTIYVSLSQTAHEALFAGTDLSTIIQNSINYSVNSVSLMQSHNWPKKNWLIAHYHGDLLNALRTVQHIQIIALTPKNLHIHQPNPKGWSNQDFVRLDPNFHDYQGSTFDQDYQINGHELIKYDSFNLTFADIDIRWLTKFKHHFFAQN